jgi:hypothetical protein
MSLAAGEHLLRRRESRGDLQVCTPRRNTGDPETGPGTASPSYRSSPCQGLFGYSGKRKRESAKLLLFYTIFALLDPNTPKCKRANATVILLIMD